MKGGPEVEWEYLSVYHGEELVCAVRVEGVREKDGLHYELVMASRDWPARTLRFHICDHSRAWRQPSGASFMRVSESVARLRRSRRELRITPMTSTFASVRSWADSLRSSYPPYPTNEPH